MFTLLVAFMLKLVKDRYVSVVWINLGQNDFSANKYRGSNY